MTEAALNIEDSAQPLFMRLPRSLHTLLWYVHDAPDRVLRDRCNDTALNWDIS